MFADDTNITFVAGTTSELESLINTELQNLNQWLKANRLSLNIAKTEFMIISSRQKQLTNTNNRINIKIENNRIRAGPKVQGGVGRRKWKPGSLKTHDPPPRNGTKC